MGREGEKWIRRERPRKIDRVKEKERVNNRGGEKEIEEINFTTLRFDESK